MEHNAAADCLKLEPSEGYDIEVEEASSHSSYSGFYNWYNSVYSLKLKKTDKNYKKSSWCYIF